MKKHRNKTIKPEVPRIESARDLFDNTWLVIGAFLVLTVIFFNKGLLSNHMIFGTDFVAGEFMKRKFVAYVMNQLHQIPLWYPDVYGGLPYVDAVAGDLFYPTSLIMRTFLPVHQMSAWTYCIHIFIAGLGTYFFLRHLKITGSAAFIAGISYMFTSSMVSLVFAGHDGKVIVSSLLPWLLLFLGKTVEARIWKKWLLWSLCSALVIGLALLSPHVQMTYYLLLAGLFFAVAKLYRLHRSNPELKGLAFKGAVRGIIVLAFGFSLYAVQAIPLQQYMKFSPRGEDKGYQFATSYSMPPEEIVNAVWPEFSGLIDKNSDQGPTHWYWGRRDLKLHTEFIGVIPFLLAIIGLIYSRRKYLKIFFISLGLFALIVAFGGFTPLYYLVYYLIPGMAKFRSPAMIFNTFSFSVVVLSALGAQTLIEGGYREKLKPGLLIGLGSVLLLGMIFSAAKDGMTNLLSAFAAKGWGTQALWQSYPEMVKGYWIFFLFLAAGAGLILLYIKGTVKLKWWAVLTGVLIFMELGRVDAKFIKVVDPPDDYFTKDEMVRAIEKDRSQYRVWPMQVHQQGSYLTLFGLQLTGGEHPNPLKRYNEYLGTSSKGLFPDYHNLLQSPTFIDMLNVKYLLGYTVPSDTVRYDEQSRAAIRGLRAIFFRYAVQTQLGQYTVYRNEQALPRAWIVGNYETIVRDKNILDRMKQPDFDPSKSVILEEKLNDFVPSGDVAGRVTFDSYHPNQVKMTAESDKPGILVMSDNHYPAWQAFIDGIPAKVYRADYTFRAVPIPAGKHSVEFKYHSRYFILGLTISIISVILVLSGITALAIMGRKR